MLNDITVSIMEPQAMADKALSYVRDKGYRVLKVKVGADVNDDIRALTLIREAVGRTSACAWTRTRATTYPRRSRR